MEPKDIPAVPCCPSDSNGTTGREAGAPWGIELGPRRAIGRCDRCHNHGITTQIRGEKHYCLFQACECRNCAYFSEKGRDVPAPSALKKEQGARLKRHLARGLIKNMAAAPRSHIPVKKLALEAGIPTGKEHAVTQPEARPCVPLQEETSQGPPVINGSPEPSSVPCTLATLEQQLTISLSGEPFVPSDLPSICSRLLLQSCATPDPLLLQQQVFDAASNQASVSDAVEWQRKLEAAEALLALRYSCWDPPESTSVQQPCNPPAAAGDGELQPTSPTLRPRPASSVSLPIGHLGCISLLT